MRRKQIRRESDDFELKELEQMEREEAEAKRRAGDEDLLPLIPTSDYVDPATPKPKPANKNRPIQHRMPNFYGGTMVNGGNMDKSATVQKGEKVSNTPVGQKIPQKKKRAAGSLAKAIKNQKLKPPRRR